MTLTLLALLATVALPLSDLVKRRAIKDLVIEGGKVSFRVVLGYAAAGKASEIINGIKARVQ